MEGEVGRRRPRGSVSSHRVSDKFIDVATLAIMRMSREAQEFLTLRNCVVRCLERLNSSPWPKLPDAVRRFQSTDYRGNKAIALNLTPDEQTLFSHARAALAEEFGGGYTNLDVMVIAMFAYLAVLPGSRL